MGNEGEYWRCKLHDAIVINGLNEQNVLGAHIIIVILL